MTLQKTVNELQKQLDSVLKFPDQNPNPVLKIDLNGKLLYQNKAGKKISSYWGIELNEVVPDEIILYAKKELTSPLELVCGNKTFSFHIVPVPELHFICIYGTDITAMKAITKFPDQNPNPVLKINNEGRLLYFNQAATSIQRAWGIQIGEQVPNKILKVSHNTSNHLTSEPLELEIKNKTYKFHIVPVPEFGFINIYGTDITAAKDNQTILLKLTKYFSPQVYESIFSGDLEVKIQTKRKRLTVFFSDIKGFSEITERLEPEVLTEIITDYLTAMTNIAVKYGGTVDKYIGDAIMVFFGDPKTKGPKQDAIACVEMALEMNKKLSEIRKTWQTKGISQPLDIRIGIHTDTCTVGNFGSHDRLDYTTIGNGVNLASRLESNAKANQILISEDTYLLIRDFINCEKLEKINVKNIKHPIQTYEVKGKIGEENQQVDENHDGFSLFIDPKIIKNVKEKKALLEEALNILNQYE
ncbi:MAG: adenylate/guanylate cyclase domain-containing protein [Bdellovibrionota bacterium]|nr:adenylate/guanylate cyclase domain-containing protein [Bdellovibrionota bacterium]